MKKLFKIGVLILMMIPSMFFVACKSKVKQISASNVKTEFYYGEDFSLGDVVVTVTYKNKKSDNVDLSDLQLNTADSTYSNSVVIVDFSQYKADRPGDYEIVVTYAKDKQISTSYSVTVSQKEFSEDDYQVTNYVGEYDGRNHSINVTTSVEGATIKYGISESNCTLEELSFRQAGMYTVYFKIEKAGYKSSVTGSGTITIAKKALEVTPKPKTILFGQPFTSAGYTASGFVGTDTKDDLSGNAYYSTDFTGEKIGTYQILMSGLESSNYRIVYNPGVLTVDKATNVLQISVPQTQYGTALNPTVLSNPSKLDISYQYSVDNVNWIDGMPENIGDYYIKATTPDSENYGPAETVVQTSITKRNLTITVKNATIEYNQEFVFDYENGIVFEGFVPGQTKDDLDGTLVVTTDYEKGSSGVGEYTIVAKGYSDSTNYNIKYTNGTLTVTPAKNVLDVTIENVTYGQNLTPVINQNLANYTVSYKYLSNIEGSNWISNVLPKNAGTYTIVASTESRGNFQYTECRIENVVINKKTLTFTCENEEIRYNEDYVEGNITNANFDGFIDGESMQNLSGIFGYTSNYVRGNDVGTYQINLTCSYGNNITHTNNGIRQNNYLLDVKTGTLTVEKADGSVQASINNITYGENFELGKNIVITNNRSAGEISFAYQTIGNNTYTDGLPTQAGYYNIRVISGETKNYNVSYDDSARGVEVKKKTLTITPNDYEVTYNQQIEEDCQFNGVTIEGFIEGEDVTNLTLENGLFYTTEYVKGSPVKSVGYKLNVSGYTSDNYDIKYNAGKLMVAKADNQIQITLKEVTYGERPAPVEVSNLAAIDDMSAVVTYKYSKDGNIWYQSIKNVGEYYVEASTKETTNYKALKVVLDGKQVIAKRTLTITPQSQIVKYKEPFVFSKVKYTYDSFAYDESVYTLDGTLSLYSTEYKCDDINNIYTYAGQDVTFTVYGYEESQNYNFEYKPGTITVIQTDTNLAVTITDNTRIVEGVSYVEYSGADLNVSTYSDSQSEVLTSYQPVEDTDENFWSTGLPKDAGSYRVKFISTEVPGQYNSEEVVKLVTIEKKNIVITPNYIELRYGQEFSDNSVKFESNIVGKNPFAPGEDISVFDGDLIITSDYSKGCDANIDDEYYNVYADTSTLSSINYNISYRQGMLRVNKADNTLKPTIVYNNDSNKLYYGEAINIDMVDKNSNGELKVEYKVVGTGDENYSETAPVNYGRYIVRVSQTATRNYNSIKSTINFEISQKVVILSWGANEFTYDGYQHVPTVEITNLEQGDECNFDVVGAQVNAGEYTAYVEKLTNTNYTLGEGISKEFIINKVVVTEPTVNAVVYNGQNQVPGIEDTDVYKVTENNGGTFAGIYPVTIELKDAVNYKWSTTMLAQVKVEFTITKATDNVLIFNNNIVKDTDNLDYSFNYNSAVTQTLLSRYGNVETLYKKLYEDDSAYTTTIPTDATYYRTYLVKTSAEGEDEVYETRVDTSVLYTSYDVKYVVHESPSYNEASITCALTINKINPVYTLPQDKNIFADKYFASGYLTELYTLEFPADAVGKWVWDNVNSAEYENGYTGAHYIVPGHMEGGEYTDGYVTEVAYFVPMDTMNYNTLEFNIDIYAYNNRLKYFDESEIFIVNKDVTYSSDGHSIDVILSGKAEGGIIRYAEEYDGEYVDTNPVFTAVNDETHVANYPVYVKVTKTVELAKNVTQTYESEILSGYVYIVDQIQSIIVTSYNYSKAVMKGETLDISDISFRAYYHASKAEELTGSQFSVTGLNTSTVGEKSVSLKYIPTNTTFTDMFTIYVYEDFVEGFSFNFSNSDSTNAISASKVSRRLYQASFTSIDQFTFYSNVTLLGTNRYNTYVSPVYDQQVILDEGEHTAQYKIELLINGSYTDTYTININSYIEEFVYSIVDVAASPCTYDSANDEYVFSYVSSDNYSQLSINYGDITGLYEVGTTEFTEENNLLTNAEISSIKFSDKPALIVEYTLGVFVYRSVIRFSVVVLPVQSVTVNSTTYNITSSYRSIDLKVQPNQTVTISFGDLDSQYHIEAFSNTDDVELRGNNITFDMIVTAEEMLEGKSYSFTVCVENSAEHIHIQMINVNLKPIDYITEFTIETDSEVFDLADNPSISIRNEFVKAVNIQVEDGYTYELYVNGVLSSTTNFVLYADKAYNSQTSYQNNIALKVTDNNGSVSYTTYTITVYYEQVDIYYNQGENYADTELDYHNIINYIETGLVRMSYSERVELDNTYTIKANGNVIDFNDELTLIEGINTVEITISKDGYMPVKIMAYFLGTTDTYKHVMSMDDTSVFGSYTIYYKGEYVGSFMASGYIVELDNYVITPSDFVVKTSTGTELNVNIELKERFIFISTEYNDVTYVSILKATFKNIIRDDNVDASFYLIDSARTFTTVTPDSSNAMTITVKSGDSIYVALVNEGARITTDGESLNDKYIYFIGDPGKTGTVHVYITASDGSTTLTYTITYEIEALKLLALNYTDTIGSDIEKDLYSKQTLTGTEYSGDFMLTYPEDNGVLVLANVDRLSNYDIYDVNGDAYVSGDKYVKVSLSGYYEDIKAYKTVDYNKILTESYSSAVSDQYSSLTDMLLKLVDDGNGNTYYSTFVLMNNVLYQIVVYTIDDTTAITHMTISINYTESGTQKTTSTDVIVTDSIIITTSAREYMGTKYTNVGLSTGTLYILEPNSSIRNAYDSNIYYLGNETQNGYGIYSDVDLQNLVANASYDSTGKYYRLTQIYDEDLLGAIYIAAEDSYKEVIFVPVEFIYPVNVSVVVSDYLMQNLETISSVNMSITLDNTDCVVEKAETTSDGDISTSVIDSYSSFSARLVSLGNNYYKGVLLCVRQGAGVHVVYVTFG